MTDLLEALTDLHKQATTERSHYYTGKLVAEAITEIAILRSALLAIAKGKPDNGKPYTAAQVRDHAQLALRALKLDWNAK
jgi:hypothetical protein